MKSGIGTAAVHRQHSRMTDAFDVPAYIAAAVSELLDDERSALLVLARGLGADQLLAHCAAELLRREPMRASLLLGATPGAAPLHRHALAATQFSLAAAQCSVCVRRAGRARGADSGAARRAARAALAARRRQGRPGQALRRALPVLRCCGAALLVCVRDN